MRIGKDVLYLESGNNSDDIITVPVEDVVASYSSRGRDNVIFTTRDLVEREDSKNIQSEFQRKLMKAIPTMVELPKLRYRSHGDKNWIVDLRHVDWDATRKIGRFGIINGASYEDLVMDSGLRIEMQYSLLVKFLQDHEKWDTFLKERTVSFRHRDSRFDEIIYVEISQHSTGSIELKLGDYYGNAIGLYPGQRDVPWDMLGSVYELLNDPDCGFTFLSHSVRSNMFINRNWINLERSKSLYDSKREGCLLSFTRPDGVELIFRPFHLIPPHELDLVAERIAQKKRFLDEEIMAVTKNVVSAPLVTVQATCFDGDEMNLVPMPHEFDHLTEIHDGRRVNARTIDRMATLQFAKDHAVSRDGDPHIITLRTDVAVNHIFFDPALCHTRQYHYVIIDPLTKSDLEALSLDLEKDVPETFINTTSDGYDGPRWLNPDDIFVLLPGTTIIYTRDGTKFNPSMAAFDRIFGIMRPKLKAYLTVSGATMWVNLAILDPDCSTETFAVGNASSDMEIDPKLAARFLVPKGGEKLWQFMVLCNSEKK